LLRFTVVPGSTVKVTPLPIDAGPVRMYGLFAFVQVVSEFIIPTTLVEALQITDWVLTNPNPPTKATIKKRVNGCFLFRVSTREYFLFLSRKGFL
jgi:hypothetical protein